MNVGLYQAISGMNSAWAQQQMIAANLARSSVPGHRAEMVAFEVKNSPMPATSSDISSAPVDVKSWINFSQGTLQPSGSSLHLAVQGDGFFTIRRKDGTIAYTRNGEFSRTNDGCLVQSDGAELLLDGNSPVKLEDKDELTLSPDGTAYSGANQIGKLALARFENPNETLAQANDGRFELIDRKKMIAGLGSTDRVVQGFLERSNIEPVEQMVNMTEVMRIYEANQRMVTTQDDLTGKLIRAVAGQ